MISHCGFKFPPYGGFLTIFAYTLFTLCALFSMKYLYAHLVHYLIELFRFFTTEVWDFFRLFLILFLWYEVCKYFIFSFSFFYFTEQKVFKFMWSKLHCFSFRYCGLVSSINTLLTLDPKDFHIFFFLCVQFPAIYLLRHYLALFPYIKWKFRSFTSKYSF